jgi:hypothetical protein
MANDATWSPFRDGRGGATGDRFLTGAAPIGGAGGGDAGRSTRFRAGPALALGAPNRWVRLGSVCVTRGLHDQRMRDPPEELSVRLGSDVDGSAG